MRIPQELLDRLYAALEGVTAVLSEVNDDNESWNAVSGIQTAINDAQEKVSELSDANQTQEAK